MARGLTFGATLLTLAFVVATDTNADQAPAGIPLPQSDLVRTTHDFDRILENRHIRALVVYNKIQYFLDGPTQRGLSHDALEQFREFINSRFDLGARGFQVVYIPVTRDRLIPALLEGIGDVAVANLTITEDRLEQVEFTDPVATGIREIVVSGPAAEPLKTLIDLAGREIYVRESSSYHQSLLELNRQFEGNDLEPVKIILVDEFLEDSDLLEMVNAGLLPMIIVDSHKAAFWRTVFHDITIHDDIPVSEEQSIGWAFRKDNPQLARVLNDFVAENRKGTLIGNILYKRYLVENPWVRNALDEDSMARYAETIDFFRHYGGQHDFDWLLLTALGYQESMLDQSRRSPAGAIGVMQLLPSTAADPNVGIEDIEILENNIHAGTKYLRFLRDRYFSDPELDDFNAMLLTFASYNAGPARIAGLRKQARDEGLDPNIWFGHMEHVVARRIGRETVQYVSNISKYYIAYRLIALRRGQQAAAN